MTLRIICRRPPPQHVYYPAETGFSDCEFLLVDEAGAQHTLDGVAGATWSVKRGEPVRATIHLHGVEIDAEL